MKVINIKNQRILKLGCLLYGIFHDNHPNFVFSTNIKVCKHLPVLMQLPSPIENGWNHNFVFLARISLQALACARFQVYRVSEYST